MPRPAAGPALHGNLARSAAECGRLRYVAERQCDAEPGADLRAQVVRLEERGAVAAEAQLDQPVASRVGVDEGGQVVGHAAVHRPLR